MKSSVKCCVLILAATTVAAALRLPRLGQRPMHGDEAVHACKFGELLERGLYSYDPNEYHGPTLNYLTLIPARLCSIERYAQLSEPTLRIVPVFFGVLLVFFVLPITAGLGPRASPWAAILAAVSPAMVFYSRYYIQEMLLVCFTFAAIVFGYRYACSRRATWAVLTGLSLGLMHATKETCIIAFASMLVGLGVVLIMRRCEGRRSFGEVVGAVRPWHLGVGVVAAVGVSVLFYSSFLSNPRGILDSITTYTRYFERAGNSRIHEHPWYYYLRMLTCWRYADGPVWTEAVIVLLACVGVVAVLVKRWLGAVDIHLARFIVFYSLSMAVVYSLVQYKTPWCMLGFLHGMILLAGLGAAALIALAPKGLSRLVVIVLLFGGSLLLLWQAYSASYRYYADSRNPYVYAHPTTEVFEVARRVEEYAGFHRDGHNMLIDVICPGDDYWPLPWYLRRFSHVRWASKVDYDRPLAPLIIASPAVEGNLAKKLYELTPLESRRTYLYLFDKPYYVWLRPKVKLVGFVRKDLWDAHYYNDPTLAEPDK